MRRAIALAALLPLLLSSCSSHGGGSCSEDDRKAAVLAIAEDWYLYADLMPEPVSLADYGSADALLEALTAEARRQGLERDGWTSLVSAAAYDQYFRQGQSVGFGYSLEVRGASPDQHLVVKQVFASSAAAAAGFHRGDDILAAGEPGGELVDIATAPSPAALASPSGVAGVTRTFRVLPRGESEPVLRTMTSAGYDVDPVPSYQVFEGGTTGYVQLRTFIAPADPALRTAFAAFRAAGVQDVIVDLRYDGGGYLSTAEVLANLLSADLEGKAMYDVRLNPRHAADDEHRVFAADPAAGTFRRVAFLVTGASASASELVPNALDPYRSPSTIAYVGAQTYGKPVGQRIFSLEDCDAMLFLLAFRLQNSNGDAGYFHGLPDDNSQAPLCPAEDDLGHEQDDPDEAMTAAARYFVEHGECPPPALRALRASPSVDPLIGVEATPAALEMPGTF